MDKKIIKITLLFAAVSMLFVACEKVEDNPLNGRTTAKFNPSVAYGTMTDKDGNTYKTVKIGSQTWMAENLRTTRYYDGALIPNITDGHEWVYSKIGAYRNYNNTSNLDTIATYGRLYNLRAVKTGKLAPEGWHVPTDEEWQELIEYLGGESVASAKLLETGFSHWTWYNPTTGASNESGFTALPGGDTFYDHFSQIGIWGFWWSSTVYKYGYLSGYGLFYDFNRSFWTSYICSIAGDDYNGYSVRCVKD